MMPFPLYTLIEQEPYAIFSEAFTPEECVKIKETGQLLQFQKGQVGGRQVVEEIRNSKIAWIEENPDTHWLFDKVARLISKINYDKFQLDLNHLDGLQFTTYDIDEHYDWHIDTNVMRGYRSPDVTRKLSLVIMLTAPDEYEGGDFEMNLNGNPDKTEKFKPRLGDMLAFYSHLPHRVQPVTKGYRASLVTWACGPKLR